MNIRPLYDRIVVKRIENDDTEKTPAVFTSPTPQKKSRRKAKLSPWARASAWKMAKSSPLDVQAGDRILFGKYSGSEIKLGWRRIPDHA